MIMYFSATDSFSAYHTFPSIPISVKAITTGRFLNETPLVNIYNEFLNHEINK